VPLAFPSCQSPRGEGANLRDQEYAECSTAVRRITNTRAPHWSVVSAVRAHTLSTYEAGPGDATVQRGDGFLFLIVDLHEREFGIIMSSHD